MSLLLGATTGVTRVLGCGARGSVAGGGEHKVLLKMTGTRWTLVLAVRILLRVAPWVVGASSRDVLLHHLSVWGCRAQPTFVDGDVLRLLSRLLLGGGLWPLT